MEQGSSICWMGSLYNRHHHAPLPSTLAIKIKLYPKSIFHLLPVRGFWFFGFLKFCQLFFGWGLPPGDTQSIITVMSDDFVQSPECAIFHPPPPLSSKFYLCSRKAFSQLFMIFLLTKRS